MTSPCSLLPDSSSPAPSSSLHPRPFSRLPTEIIQHVVDSIAPFHYHPETYVERQSTLSSLCLTSRLFRQLASPYLYAMVKLETRKQVDAFRDTEQVRANVMETRELFLYGDGFELQFGDLYPLLSVTFSLRTLKLNNFGYPVGLKQLSRLKNLSTLHLNNTILRASVPCVLPRVEELCLQYVLLEDPWEDIFSPATLPALRLGDQLEILWIDNDHKAQLAADVFDGINQKTLFDQYLVQSSSTLPDVHSLRLWDDPPYLNAWNLNNLGEMVQASTTPLPSVLYLAGCHSLDPHDPALEASRQRLITIGKERNMEVSYEESPEWDVDSGRPKEFYRRMRGGKVKERSG